MRTKFNLTERKALSCLSAKYCILAPDDELTEVVMWGNKEGYDIIISNKNQASLIALSRDHFKLISEMIKEIEQ